MNNYIILILFLISIMIIRMLINLQKFLYLKKALMHQDIYVRGAFENASKEDIQKANKSGNWCQENLLEIKRIVLETGIEDITHTHMEPIGYGSLQQHTMSALDNMLYKNITILLEARDIIDRAKGYYKVQAKNSMNPLFWIEFLVFLPKKLIKYLNISEGKKTLINIIQIVYWIGGLVFMYLNYKK